jgi:hypothetical protein
MFNLFGLFKRKKSNGTTNHLLPDIYAGELNVKRIKAYMDLKDLYTIEEGTIRDIFCKGADFYKKCIKIEPNYFENALIPDWIDDKDLPKLSIIKKDQNESKVKWLLKDFCGYHNYDIRMWEVHLVEVVTNAEVVNISITLGQPGLLIGKQGQTIKNIEQRITKVIGKEAKIKIIEFNAFI